MPAKNRSKQLENAQRATAKKVFLREYAKHGVIGPAAKCTGFHRNTISHWRGDDEEFDEACEDAFQNAVDDAEHELRKRGVEGWDEPILFKGEPVWKRDPDSGEVLLDEDFNPIPFTIPRKSDRLLEVYTRSHRPIYKEKTEVALTNPNGSALDGPMLVQYVLPSGKTVEDYDQPPIEGKTVQEQIALEEDEDDWLK